MLIKNAYGKSAWRSIILCLGPRLWWIVIAVCYLTIVRWWIPQCGPLKKSRIKMATKNLPVVVTETGSTSLQQYQPVCPLKLSYWHCWRGTRTWRVHMWYASHSFHTTPESISNGILKLWLTIYNLRLQYVDAQRGPRWVVGDRDPLYKYENGRCLPIPHI